MPAGSPAGAAGTTGPVAPTAADGVAAVATDTGPRVVPSATTAPAAASSTRGEEAASCSRRMAGVLRLGGPCRAAAGRRTTGSTAGDTARRGARKDQRCRGWGALGASAPSIGRRGTFLSGWAPSGPGAEPPFLGPEAPARQVSGPPRLPVRHGRRARAAPYRGAEQAQAVEADHDRRPFVPGHPQWQRQDARPGRPADERRDDEAANARLARPRGGPDATGPPPWAAWPGRRGPRWRRRSPGRGRSRGGPSRPRGARPPWPGRR